MKRNDSTAATNYYKALAHSGLLPTALAGLPPSLESFAVVMSEIYDEVDLLETE